MSAYDPKRTLASLAMLSPKSIAKPGPTMSASKPWGQAGMKVASTRNNANPASMTACSMRPESNSLDI